MAEPRRKIAVQGDAPMSQAALVAVDGTKVGSARLVTGKTTRSKAAPAKQAAAKTVRAAPEAAPAKRRAAPRVKPAIPPVAAVTDAPDDGAAHEVMRIRDGMARIRDLLDRAPLPPDRAQMLLDGLSRPPLPRRVLAGSTASVIELMPPAASSPVVPPAASIAPSMALVLRTDPPASPPSRVGRLVSAWGDWLTWKLSPPGIPSDPRGRRTDTPRPGSATVIAAPPPAPALTDAPPTVAAAPTPPVDRICIADVVAQSVAQILSDAALRGQLQDMIREEMEGEMGARFSANLGSLVRRQVAEMLDDRLTHL